MSDHVEELAQAIAHHFSCMDEARMAVRDVIAAGWRPPETTTATLQRHVDEDRKRWNEQWRSEQ